MQCLCSRTERRRDIAPALHRDFTQRLSSTKYPTETLLGKERQSFEDEFLGIILSVSVLEAPFMIRLGA